MNEKTLAAEQLDGRQVAPGFNIRNIKISPGLVLAPMSGVTTSAFRRLLKSTNPGAIGLVVSEFISVEALTRQVVRSLEMMRFRPEERPVGIQIFGYDINRLRDAAMMVQDAGVDLIDLNCGCPAPKVVRKGGGCELMRIPDHLCKIVREIRRSVSIPFYDQSSGRLG
jgi:tRNA-dihydrouridine synthase B